MSQHAEVRSVQDAALARDQLQAKLEIGGVEHDKLMLHYPAIKQCTGYVSPVVTLEFGVRATGEPHQVRSVTCDMDGHVEGVKFPTASPLVTSVARTFWEKATAAHAVAKAVAEHKSYFFVEKDTRGAVIDYFPGDAGKLQLVPEGAARGALATDYANMLADEVMVGDALPFNQLMDACAEVAAKANATATS